MRAQIRVDVVSISVAPIQSLLQRNNIGITYAETSNFRTEPRRFVPLYYMVMPQFIITITFNTSYYCWQYEIQTTHSKGNKICEFA